MKKNTNASMVTMFAVLASALLGSQVFAYNPIQSQLDFGETNFDVTSLQTFFRDNSAIYPEGLVTGYFGGLTRSAVQRYQESNGLISSGSAATTGYGRVGPMTRDSINIRINAGGWTVTDMSGPSIYSVSQTIGRDSASFTWNTNELASAKVFYNTSPVAMNEGDINSVGFGSTNGLSITNDNLARTSQQITLSGLQPNTRYYYVVVATDLKGNVSVWNPNTYFVTNQ